MTVDLGNVRAGEAWAKPPMERKREVCLEAVGARGDGGAAARAVALWRRRRWTWRRAEALI
jgi:hypothetical protein